MQTFLPHGIDFKSTAETLDRQRLLKQAVEAYQILRINAGLTNGWRNHPAVKMWAGSEGYLYLYTNAIIDEVERRGYRNTYRGAITDLMDANYHDWHDDIPPPWIHDDRIKITHRGRLYEKSPEQYPQFLQEFKKFRNYVCCRSCNYFWPSHTIEYSFTENMVKP